MDSVVITVLQKKVKQVEGIKEQRSMETREHLKCCETREVHRYTSAYLISNSVSDLIYPSTC